jgi:hypothetical protein
MAEDSYIQETTLLMKVKEVEETKQFLEEQPVFQPNSNTKAEHLQPKHNTPKRYPTETN